MKNKKAVLRVIEAVIGVMIILMALIYFVAQQTKNLSKEEKIKEIARTVLDSIEKNQTMRDYIINNEIDSLNDSIKAMLLNLFPQYDFDFCIAEEIFKICSPLRLPEKKDIYADSLFVSYEEGGIIKTKKFMLYLWLK
ncbi:MAG: hypothetical protein QW244_00865 [Candidatus Pacearchaeota archaeon]